MLTLYPHQRSALTETEDRDRVAYYLDMGLGKTFVGSEKMDRLGACINLVICQKSKVDDWVQHFREYYPEYDVANMTTRQGLMCFKSWVGMINNPTSKFKIIGVINYDLAWRRKELRNFEGFTLILDESSLIQNETAKRSKFIMKLNFKNLILLSGTPTGGKYEKLWSQLKMLGYNMTKSAFYNTYVKFHYDTKQGFPLMVIDGYKNVERLKRKMREHGCVFMKSDEVFDLPQQNFINIRVDTSREYRKFRKDSICMVKDIELVGDNTLTKMLYERQLCGLYNNDKLKAFRDLVESTNDRLIVFYNFTEEWHQMGAICDELERPSGVVNGQMKILSTYEKYDNSVTFIQYQAGAMGLNLQKANKIVYFTPPLSSELFEQSKKRIHRIGQNKPCFYYYMVCKNSIEEKIYKTLEMRKDYTNALFERGD